MGRGDVSYQRSLWNVLPLKKVLRVKCQSQPREPRSFPTAAAPAAWSRVRQVRAGQTQAPQSPGMLNHVFIPCRAFLLL